MRQILPQLTVNKVILFEIIFCPLFIFHLTPETLPEPRYEGLFSRQDLEKKSNFREKILQNISIFDDNITFQNLEMKRRK